MTVIRYISLDEAVMRAPLMKGSNCETLDDGENAMHNTFHIDIW